MANDTPSEKAAEGPYVLAAMDYLNAGWSPIPIRHNSDGKAPLVGGVTGYAGRDVTAEDVAEWSTKFPASNIGLRVPRTVLGIDVDKYDGKTGGQQLRYLVREFGPLPATWVTTSRTDGSGIRLYHVEDGTQFSDPGGGIEVVRWCHRFAMAAPSRHPRSTRPRYFWINPAREIVRDEIPVPFQLAELPEEWVEGLRSRIPRGPRPAGTVEGGARAWALSRPGGNCEPCVVLRATLNRYTAELEAGGGAHPVMVTGTHALIGDSALGHVGLYWALKRFAKLYLSAVKGRRSADTATAEFHRAVDSEVTARVAAGIDDVDPCSWDFSGWAR